MVKIRCQDCGRIVDVQTGWDTYATCNDCGGDFAELDSEDDLYEEEESEEEDEDSDDEDEEEETYECENCEESYSDKKDVILFDLDCDDSEYNVCICKKCIDKKYPREVETEIKYRNNIIEKEVKIFVDKEGIPIDNSFNPDNKSKFD